jgi:hypothetical protein
MEKYFGNIKCNYLYDSGTTESQYSLKIYYKDFLIYMQNTEGSDTEKILELTKDLSINIL